MRKPVYLCYVAQFFLVLSLSTLFTTCSKKSMRTEIKILPHYPSASGIEYFNNHFYIIGDDANNLLITDSSLNSIDAVSLYSFTEKRIPKPIKADLEAITALPELKLRLRPKTILSATA